MNVNGAASLMCGVAGECCSAGVHQHYGLDNVFTNNVVGESVVLVSCELTRRAVTSVGWLLWRVFGRYVCQRK